MASSLLALLDDIATIMDDVAVLTKISVKKTAGVLGDDLALNAEQASGLTPSRELPVVWAIAKGSFLNKLILVPLALVISALVPVMVLPLLMLGGLYLCYEGAEKVIHAFSHFRRRKEHQELIAAVADPSVDMVAHEKGKIKNAIRTDFILSAEIVTITLGQVAGQPLLQQVGVLSAISMVMTVGVYGLVAGIVKLDDLGLALHQKQGTGASFQRTIGKGILIFSPYLMKLLSVAGTLAMFLVGGGIVVHGFSALHGLENHFIALLGHKAYIGGAWTALSPLLFQGFFGFILGAGIWLIKKGAYRLKAMWG